MWCGPWLWITLSPVFTTIKQFLSFWSFNVTECLKCCKISPPHIVLVLKLVLDEAKERLSSLLAISNQWILQRSEFVRLNVASHEELKWNTVPLAKPLHLQFCSCWTSHPRCCDKVWLFHTIESTVTTLPSDLQYGCCGTTVHTGDKSQSRPGLAFSKGNKLMSFLNFSKSSFFFNIFCHLYTIPRKTRKTFFFFFSF